MTITAGFDYFAKYAGPEAVAKIEQKIAEAKINKYKIVAVSCVSPCKSN
jgi:hypothetical protein